MLLKRDLNMFHFQVSSGVQYKYCCTLRVWQLYIVDSFSHALLFSRVNQSCNIDLPAEFGYNQLPSKMCEYRNVIFKVILFSALMKSITCTSEPVCCTPDQWEASMFWDNGNAFIDGKEKLANPAVGTAFSYINGTLKTAYDFTNGHTFINASIIEISPLIPKPVIDHTTLIRDYKNGVEYQFGPSSCQKSKLDPLKRHCVPGTALHLGSGTLGKENVPVSTYAYTLQDFPYKFQSTVTQKGCLPVHVTYLVSSSEPDSGALYNLEVSDVTPGIKDPSIFNIPPQCKSIQANTAKPSRWLEPFL